MLTAARGVGVARWLREHTPIRIAVPGHGSQGLPERVARAVCESAGLDPGTQIHALTQDQRARLVHAVTQSELPVTGDRGFTAAETTAGGIPLREVHLATMESRVRPGLFLCGEVLDVDGRIGGFNFQWAWASGYAAGLACAMASFTTP